ncbi:unnamed protein product [Phytomonas sp. EM1]|nr:unnamed protein product [Phytomonas sp. EM1]|eukprot:CCW59868.1 unnamed protein product [Phytomonas sp. isolate EM1]
MSILATKIESDLLAACQARDAEAFRAAFATLDQKRSDLPFEAIPAALSLRCCEEAIWMEVWEIADLCLARLRAEATLTPILESRVLFCESRLRCQRNDDDAARGGDWIQHRHACAALAVQGIKLALRQTPCEMRLVMEGADLLWGIVEPIYFSGNFAAVLEVVVFLKSLYDRLGIGGGYTRMQWGIRHATCLRGLGLPQDALPIVNEAMEISSRLHHDRLHLQLQRFLSLTLAEKDLGNSKTTRGEGSSLGSVKGLYQHTVHLTQLIMSGHIELNPAVYLDLINLYERINASQKRKTSDPFTETAMMASSMVKITPHPKGGKSAKNQQQQLQITENDITDPQVQQEVLGDLVFCLVVYGEEEWGGRAGRILQQLARNAGARGRVLAALVDAVGVGLKGWQTFHATSLPPDAPFARRSAQLELLRQIRKVEKLLPILPTIPDRSDRLYVLMLVCFVLWKLCLPLLNTDVCGHLSSTLDHMIKALEGYPNAFIPPYVVYLFYESSLAELNHGSLSVARLRAEKALLWNQRHFFYRHHARVGGVAPHAMEFAIMWLRHCIEVADGMAFNHTPASLGDEDQVLFLIMQAKRAKKGMKRVQFLKDAYAKLAALESMNDKGRGGSVEGESTGAPSTSSSMLPETPALIPLRRRTRASSRMPSALIAECPPRRSLVELCAMFLQECRREMTPSLLTMMKTTAGVLCGLSIRPDGRFPELVHLQAQAHLIYAEIIALESDGNAAKGEFHALEGAEFLVQATVLDAACVARGASTGWVTVSACELFLRQYNAHLLLDNGGNRGMHHYLNELYTNHARLNTLVASGDPTLSVNLAFAYVLSMIREYIESKGAIHDELAVVNVEEFIRRLFGYPKTDANHPLLRKAYEVCQEVVQRVKEPSCKVHLCLLLPCLCRLLGMTPKTDPTAPPQEQLLHLLGRVSGPIPREEKLALLKKEMMELLAVDPSVQLCGRVAMLALELHQDHLVAEAFRWGNALYAKGRLAWGSSPPRTSVSPGSTLANSTNSTITTPLRNDPPAFPSSPLDTEGSNPLLPPLSTTPMQPNSEDWMWYARLLYCQALTFHRRIPQASLAIARRLYEGILSLATNASLAVAFALEASPPSRAHLVEGALALYYEAFCGVGFAGHRPPPAILVSSLKVMLSKRILSLVLDGKEIPSEEEEGGGGRGARKTTSRLHQSLCQMSAGWFRAYAITNARVAEVVSGLAYLRSKLPLSLQKQLALLEIVYTGRVNQPGEQKVSDMLGCDAATKALAWMALARSAPQGGGGERFGRQTRCRHGRPPRFRPRPARDRRRRSWRFGRMR